MTQEIDISMFADMMFNPIQFINRAFEANRNNEEFVRDAVQTLQSVMTRINISLDEREAQMDSAVPQVMEDAATMQFDCADLEEKVLDLEKHVLVAEAATGAYTQGLVHIDNMKSRLERSKSIAENRAKWHDLVDSLEGLLVDADYSDKEFLKIASVKIKAIMKSLDSMADCPDYHDRKLQVERICSRVMSLSNNAFEEALHNLDKDKTNSYMELYSSMERMGSASQSWRRTAAKHVGKRWTREPEHTMRALTKILIDEAVQQVEWLHKVIQPRKPKDELVRLHTNIVLSLDPSITKVMKSKYKKCKTPQNKLKMLTALGWDISSWLSSFHSVIKSMEHDKNELNYNVVEEFVRAAFAPLKELLPKYADAQSQVFLSYMELTALVKEQKEDDFQGRSEIIIEIAHKCEHWLKIAYHNALFIAGTAINPYFAIAAETLASAFLSTINSHLSKIETSFQKTVKTRKVSGINSEAFRACLKLELAIDVLLATFNRDFVIDFSNEVTFHYKLDYPTILLDDNVRKTLTERPWAAPHGIAGLRRAKNTVKALYRTILKNPVDVELDKIPKLTVWRNIDGISADLPDFAFAPQEYITEIGQYLMTLPEHLDTALLKGDEPLQFLNEVCMHTCIKFTEKVLHIRNLDYLGMKRCLVDIAYLSSVVEDLGGEGTSILKDFEKSLRKVTQTVSKEK